MTQRKDKVEGEGSYSGTKDYNERQRKFMPENESEKHEMQKAERIGKQHAKGEDPALRDPKKVPHEGHKHQK